MVFNIIYLEIFTVLSKNYEAYDEKMNSENTTCVHLLIIQWIKTIIFFLKVKIYC
jgi:hypothetical protein